MNLNEARTRFINERPQYEALARRVEEEARAQLRGKGLDCQVSGRAKEVASFVSKSLRKGYADPWNDVTDKAGVRVTVAEPQMVLPTVTLLKVHFGGEVEDKTAKLREENEIGYGGVHIQVDVTPDTALVGGECEIQVRTAAQHLWSEMSHKLLYKPGLEPDPETHRALLRLSVLTEIFDEEVTRRVKQIAATEGFSVEELVSAAEAEYYQFADNVYDRALSRTVISQIATTIPPTKSFNGIYEDELKRFVENNHQKLTGIYQRYRESESSQLIHQPESIIIFERIHCDIYTLEALWGERLPRDELDTLTAIWGS